MRIEADQYYYDINIKLDDLGLIILLSNFLIKKSVSI